MSGKRWELSTWYDDNEEEKFVTPVKKGKSNDESAPVTPDIVSFIFCFGREVLICVCNEGVGWKCWCQWRGSI